MNYYEDIKKELINNEINRKVKTHSINKSDLTTYYNVGKTLSEAGKCYGESIIKEYSKKLTNELGKGYGVSNLKRFRQFYLMAEKGAPLAHLLTWSHYVELLTIKDINKLIYYINITISQSLSKRELRNKIKNKEYERLDEETKNKLINNENLNIKDNIKNPILIKNIHNYTEITEKILQKLVLEDISSFMKELGDSFSFIDNEYKIKIGERYNYIDLLLFNIKFNCYVVIELKVTELKKEHIGQIQIYMNYVDKNIKTINQDKTIGVIICKKDNGYYIEYSSDNRIFSKNYILS